MQIQWFGHNFIKAQGKDASILFDPFGKETGLKVPKVQGEIVCFSQRNDELEKSFKESHVLNGPGEYEISGIFIFAFTTPGPEDSANTVYMAEVDGMYITHLGNLSGSISEDALEILRKTDVLCVPVGDKDALSSKQAQEVISVIEPGLVIPIHYKTDGLNADLQGIDVFAKEVGIDPNETQDKIKVSKKDFVDKRTDFAILSV